MSSSTFSIGSKIYTLHSRRRRWLSFYFVLKVENGVSDIVPGTTSIRAGWMAPRRPGQLSLAVRPPASTGHFTRDGTAQMWSFLCPFSDSPGQLYWGHLCFLLPGYHTRTLLVQYRYYTRTWYVRTRSSLVPAKRL